MRRTPAPEQPYAYVTLTRGDLRLRLPHLASQRVDAERDPRVLGCAWAARLCACCRQQVTWSPSRHASGAMRLPAERRYLSAAVLPDGKPETLALFARHAFAFVQDTRVRWRYDVAASRVETTFRASTRAMEGETPARSTACTRTTGTPTRRWTSWVQPSTACAARSACSRRPVQDHGTLRRLRALVAARLPKARAAAEARGSCQTDLRNARRMMLPEGQSAYWRATGPATHRQADGRGRAAGATPRSATSCWRC